METSRSDEAIVRSTIELGRNLDLQVTAEGVETREALDRLDALGCDYAQGFHVGAPGARPTAAARDIERFVRAGRDRRGDARCAVVAGARRAARRSPSAARDAGGDPYVVVFKRGVAVRGRARPRRERALGFARRRAATTPRSSGFAARLTKAQRRRRSRTTRTSPT